MARKCSVCKHSKREEIDQAIVDGVSYRAISRHYGVGRDALRRHATNHLPRALAKAYEAAEVAKASINRSRSESGEKAEKNDDYGTALRGIKEARACLELLARMRGELEQVTVNVLQLPEWSVVQGVIYRTLKTYPEVRRAFMEASEAKKMRTFAYYGITQDSDE